jgi:hypothetical protein
MARPSRRAFAFGALTALAGCTGLSGSLGGSMVAFDVLLPLALVLLLGRIVLASQDVDPTLL